MESNMVRLLEPQDCLRLVDQYFKREFKNFKLIKSTSYTGYGWLEYQNENNLRICFDGDIGGHFYVKIIIEKEELELWQYNRSVNNVSQSTKENILYQLSILKSFLENMG